jgi:hypothetical protein
MNKWTDEERALGKKLTKHMSERGREIVEARLKEEVGPELAKTIMQKIDEMVKKGKNEKEIVEALRNLPELVGTGETNRLVAIGVAANVAIYGYVVREAMS